MASSTQAPSLLLHSIITLSLLLLASCLHGATASVVLCNHKSYDEDDPFGASLLQVLSDLVYDTAWSVHTDKYVAFPDTTSPLAYGHAACSNTLKQDDCELCLKYAVKQILETCGHSKIGATSKLENCMLRYEKYAFKD